MRDLRVHLTIEALLEHLDGWGLVITDEDLIREQLLELGYSPSDQLQSNQGAS